eukprot:CAMPEP_0201979746 /NCGR_PEP_ID=MMETSP0904-20121228/68255_1 /ASSEMBLY_ACC=CAM_ASM_000553 /TAXON_ID=420261 /ORGANISM="Thalassiosira antarctica, Strain CCMP982" /LENGTH=33 /DNA_ID= /DNA_START= /DNA_END= /DNA_ORIENTATION=
MKDRFKVYYRVPADYIGYVQELSGQTAAIALGD